MKTNNFPASTCQHCRHCRYFVPEGRRGGNCEQLGALVRGGWKACSLAIPAFAPSWEVIEGIAMWQAENLRLEEVVPLDSKQKVAAVGDPTENRRSQSAALAEELVVA